MGFFLRPLSFPVRFFLFVSSLGMFWHDYRIRIAGTLLFLVVLGIEIFAFYVKKRLTRETSYD